MRTDTSSWTVLARVLRPQGRKGEVLAELLTDFPESLSGRENLFLVPEGFDGGAEAARSVRVSSSWLPVGKNRGRIVLQLEGIASISEAESLAGLDLAVPQESRLPLDQDSTYVSDLIGCTVYDRETVIGEISDVQFPASADGARLEDVPSLLEVRSADGGEVLIPFVHDFLVSTDVQAKKLVLKLPAGLVDVNR